MAGSYGPGLKPDATAALIARHSEDKSISHDIIVPIIMGSKADLSHAQAIARALDMPLSELVADREEHVGGEVLCEVW